LFSNSPLLQCISPLYLKVSIKLQWSQKKGAYAIHLNLILMMQKKKKESNIPFMRCRNHAWLCTVFLDLGYASTDPCLVNPSTIKERTPRVRQFCRSDWGVPEESWGRVLITHTHTLRLLQLETYLTYKHAFQWKRKTRRGILFYWDKCNQNRQRLIWPFILNQVNKLFK